MHTGLGKTKLAVEAGAYAKRPIDAGYGTVQGLAELDAEDLELVDARMRKGDAKLLMGRPSKVHAIRGRRAFEKNGGDPASGLNKWPRGPGGTTDSVSNVET